MFRAALTPGAAVILMRVATLALGLMPCAADAAESSAAPSDAAAIYARGVAAAKAGRIDAALADLNQAIRLSPGLADAYNYRGAVHWARGDAEAALADYGKAISLGPRFQYYYNRAEVYLTRRENERAIADYSEAIRLDPGHADAFNNRGNAYFNLMENERALADYTEAARLDPAHGGVQYNRANTLRRLRRYEQAIEAFDRAVALDPGVPEPYTSRGLTWRDLGMYDKARADFLRAAQINPRHAQAYNGLAWIAAICPDVRYRDGRKAIELATTACELSAWQTVAYFSTLAAAYAEAGEFDKAIQWQKEYLASIPAGTSAVNGQGRLALYQQGKPYHQLIPIAPAAAVPASR